MIRPVSVDDAGALCSIYNYYIENTIITFEDKKLSVDAFTDRIIEITKRYPWWVYEENNSIVGYAYANTWKTRSAYIYSAEATVYLAAEGNVAGRGIGTTLYRKLNESLKKQGISCVIGGVALPNEASMGMHKKLGFRYVGTFNKVGFKFDQWLDVAYWQILL